MGTHWASTLVGSPLEATSGTCNSASSIPIALLTDQDGDVNGFLIFLYGEEVKGYRYELPNEQVNRVNLPYFRYYRTPLYLLLRPFGASSIQGGLLFKRVLYLRNS
jgi:hypothetical protein